MSDYAIPSTITEQVENIKSMDLCYRTLHRNFTIINDTRKVDIVSPFISLTNKYRDFLSNIIIKFKLSDEEQEEYRYKPKTLSEELYGTPEYWNDLLVINGCFSISDFTPKVVNVYDPDEFKSYLNEIMMLESGQSIK